MTTVERIQALETLGYDPDEAQFLSIAALHSGYFVRRQFLTFIGGTKGWKDVVFLEKLGANSHGIPTVYRHDRLVYHLCSKPLYAALGEPNNRNRRQHQPTTIKNKIMVLDFVLEHPDYDYYPTERHKLDYFVGTQNIAREDLPTKLYSSPYGHPPTSKHFVESYPMFLLSSPDGRPLPHFCYVDEGLQSTDRFATFLRQYRRLFRALGDFRVIYVAAHSALFASAERVFQKLLESTWPSPDVNVAENEQLIAYFRRRRAYEERDFSDFDTAGLIRFREEKKRFASEPYERLYTVWKGQDLEELRNFSAQAFNHQTPVSERFSTHVLDYDYDLFGTLTNGNHKRTNPEIQTEL